MADGVSMRLIAMVAHNIARFLRFTGSVGDLILGPKRPRGDRYSLEGGSIVKNPGRRRSDSVVVAQIARWWVVYEMVFDIVCIELVSGEFVQWLDFRTDLLGILREHPREGNRRRLMG